MSRTEFNRLVKDVAKANAGTEHLKNENINLCDKLALVVEQTKQENAKMDVPQSYSGNLW